MCRVGSQTCCVGVIREFALLGTGSRHPCRDDAEVLSQCEDRRLFQIEIQLLVFANLAPRILYAWADLFSQQLQRGEDYRVLQPVYIPSARGFSAALHAPRTPGRRCASSP
jgi:hypothetical protein